MLLVSTIFGALVIGVASDLRTCDSCSKINNCPQALELVTNNRSPETANKIRKAYCGTDGVIKVCCTDFLITSRNLPENSNEENKEDEIENHPNLHLLSNECGDIEGNRIIGGVAPTLYEFPWLALISHRVGRSLKFNCGGTVISSMYVLTAAHCIKGHEIAGVRIGDYDISKKIDCYGVGVYRECESKYQDIAVIRAIAHPDYVRIPVVLNDIGLLRLKKPVDFKPRNAAAVCLPVFQNLREMDITGERGTVAGWGVTESQSRSNILLKVSVPIYSHDTCKAYYERNRKPGSKPSNRLLKTFCAGELGRDSCSGDSGGPLMLESPYNETYKMVQFGIVSYGPSQCGANTPGVYTDLRKFMKWILDTLEP
ncbi:unnamed protein product, partial [Iphiclides podalirius]